MSGTNYSWLNNSWLNNYRAWFLNNYWLWSDNDWLWFCNNFCWLNHRLHYNWFGFSLRFGGRCFHSCWLDNWFDHGRSRFLSNRLYNRFGCRFLIERFWLFNNWLDQRNRFDHSWCWFLDDRLWLCCYDWFRFWFWFWFFDNNGCWFDNRFDNSRFRYWFDNSRFGCLFDNRLDNSRFGFFRSLGSRLGSRYNLDLFFFFPSSSFTTSVCITSLFTGFFFWLWGRGTSLFFPVIFIIISASSTATSASS